MIPNFHSQQLLRILDANANRVLEGLRVIEEYPRFVLNNADLAEELKQLRHNLATSLEQIPKSERLQARDTENDVGTGITTRQEVARPDLESVAAANLQRVFQALRALEEYGKVGWPSFAAQVEKLRYRLYTVEKRLSLSTPHMSPRHLSLAAAQLYVLIDGGTNEVDFIRRAESLVRANVPVVQLRDKHLPDRILLDRARQLRSIVGDAPTLIIINDRPDLARLSAADGVHVGQDEIPAQEARAILGPQGIVGVSTHSESQVNQAVEKGADYLGCGPTFISETKCFPEFAGLDFLRKISSNLPIPAFAIGGISEANLDEVLATGMTRIAVQQAVWGADDPGAAAKRLLERLGTVPLPSELGQKTAM